MHPNGKIIQSWDTAATTSDLSDYSVCTTWLIKDDYFYLLNVFRRKLEYPDLIRAVIQLGKQYGARQVLIEDTSSGVALLQQLRRERTGLNFFSVKPDKDKVTRLKNASVEIEAGRVLLPEKAPWLDDYLTEMLAFPGGVHDDQVDSTSQFLNYYPNRPRMTVTHVKGLY